MRILKKYRVWLIFLILLLVVPVFAFSVITTHAKKMEQQTFNNLSAIADLKASQIATWLADQNRIAKVIGTNTVLRQQVELLLHDNQNQETVKTIVSMLNAVKDFYQFNVVSLISPDNQSLIPVDLNPFLASESQQLIQQSLINKTIKHSDIIIKSDDVAYLDYIVPIINDALPDKPVMAFVIFQVNLHHFIFPYVQYWPTPSTTGETLLVRQTGTDLEFLTPLKALPSLSDTNLKQQVSKTMGLEILRHHRAGTFIGKDYRGIDVFSAYRPIRGTDWMLISKIDVEEASKALRDLIVWLSIVTLFSVIVVGLALVMFLKKQRQAQALALIAEHKQSESILQLFYELPFIGMAIVDARAEKWVRFNSRLTEILGFSMEALSQKALKDVLYEKDYGKFMQNLSNIESRIVDGSTFDARLVCRDGHVVFCVVHVQGVHKENVLQFYLLTIQDVTDFKELVAENLVQKHQLSTLVQTIPDLIWLKDLDGVYLNCNAAFEKLYGATEENIIGKTDYDFVDSSLADFFREHDLNAMKQDKPIENEEWLTFADGGYHGLFSTIKTPMRDDSGRVIGILGVARDITKRKMAEMQLERLTALYSALSQTNETIVRCQNETELFQRVCEICVQHGGMQLAWIGLINVDTGKVSPVAFSGQHGEYLDGLAISINEKDAGGHGPTAIAARMDEPYWCQDFLKDKNTAVWHERAATVGWLASASIPLHRKGQVIGTLNLYSNMLNAFDQLAKDVLIEMSSDIDFALNNFAMQKERVVAEHSREEALVRLQKLAERLPGVVYQYRMDAQGVASFPFASEAIYDIYRVRPEEVADNAAKVFEVIHPDDYKGLEVSVIESAQNLTPWFYEYRVKYPDGTVRWLSGNAMPEREMGGATLWHGFITDITERKEIEAQINLASKVFEQSREGIMITDPQQRILLVNQMFTEITGYTADEVRGKSPNMLSSGRHAEGFYANLWQSVAEEGHWQGEIWNRRKNGEIYPEWLTISRGLDKDGKVTEYVGMFSDISKVKESEDKIQHLAHYDPLTNLVNRQLLMDRLQHAISAAKRNGTPLALFFIDLDHFKNVNDTLGHHIGDELLVEVSQRMSRLLRAEDTLSRQGGDEFIVVLPGADESGALHVAQKIVEVVSQQLNIGYDELFITPSIGIAIYPQDGEDVHTLLKNADAAMYQAKQDGRNNYRFFTAAMQARSTRLMRIENALRVALARDEFVLHYQPQICAKTQKIIGVEALIRWYHPEMGLVSPMEFIPVAEQSGQILSLGGWVLRTAIQQLKKWIDQGYEPFVVAVNLSAIQFKQVSLPNQVMQMLTEVGLKPQYLELELTESVAMSNPEAAIQMINKLVSQGIQIAIDDFGTGYSSLSYLKRFNATKLKIDQSFVRDVIVDQEDQAIVRAIISLARNLGLKTIAEGVESVEQLSFLEAERCDEIQGYYFSCPLPADEFETFLKNYSPSTPSDE